MNEENPEWRESCKRLRTDIQMSDYHSLEVDSPVIAHIVIESQIVQTRALCSPLLCYIHR